MSKFSLRLASSDEVEKLVYCTLARGFRTMDSN